MSHQQIMRNRGYGGNIPDGNSHGGSSKHSDSMSDEVPPPHRLNKNGRVLDDSDMDGHIPYEVLMNDLTQAKSSSNQEREQKTSCLTEFFYHGEFFKPIEEQS